MRNGAVDEAALRKLVNWHIKEGTNGFVPVGTTGESPTVSHDEHQKIIEIVVDETKGRIPVIAGTGSNNTYEAIDYTRFAAKAGADAVLSVVPYYNKPTQEGIYQHFKAITEAVDIPMILYNVPGRTVADIQVDTVDRLARDFKNIIGIKDASADLNRPSLQRVKTGTDFLMLSGEDGTALGFNAHGGVGCISVTANVAPALCSQMQAACRAGDYTAAIKIQDRLMPLHSALFTEPSPGPVKYAASLLGLCEPDLRLPLLETTPECQARVKAAMIHAGLIN